MLSHQVDMEHHQKHRQARQHQDMQGVETSEGGNAHALGTAQKLQQVIPENRHQGGNLDRHHRGPIGPVVPGEQVAGQPKGQHQQ